MNDKYTHSDEDVIYITESILGPAESSPDYDVLLDNYNSQMLVNCDCTSSCNINMKCKCLLISHGVNYNLKSYCDEKFAYILDCNKCSMIKDYPIIECNSNCQCPATCGNRVVQRGPIEGLIVKPCDNTHKGLGLFASCFINKGTFICEYAGELITRTQALKRTEENDAQGKMNYIFCLNEHSHDEGFIQTFVDPSRFGNIGRYVNHSCEPNCSIVPVRFEIIIPRLAIFAHTDILPGEEITFRYGKESKTHHGDTKFTATMKQCMCNAETCSGFLPCENF